MELLIVIAAAIAVWAVGSVWYMVLAAPWGKFSGLQVENRGAPSKSSPLPYLVSGAAMVVFVAMMRYLWHRAGISGLGDGLWTGLLVGLFLILPWTVINQSYARRPLMQSVISGGYVLVACTICGGILGAI
ncbi:MAG: DUF1761 domain-containing protein [Paracoccus sp. (in: a-proteobacteria)]|uniref:DUF1761 domain-containing protein n=1 Tax=Paracoccus sp. TaxID=267 RepID=UPI0026DEFD6E|nr:DUF1761 domain-containing protein [Paracoccus sp. (in: a-proteobacteria)]MDO5621212.1 DUF1761 domain-containing protein [Paracoccus sp. (in: a-proteobacteria)]